MLQGTTQISSRKMGSLLIWKKERVQGLKHKPATGKEKGEKKAAGFSALLCRTLWPPQILPVQQGGQHPSFSVGTGQMNVSETTKRFFFFSSLEVLAGTTYVSWMVPWKAVTWAGAARLPLCSRASRCHPLCLPPSPAATTQRGTASAKNNQSPSGAA